MDDNHVTEITKKQRIEPKALLFSPAFQHIFLERIGEAGVIIANQKGDVVYVSQRACHVLGESCVTLLQKNYINDLHFLNENSEVLRPEQRPVWNALHTKNYNQVTPYFCWFVNSLGEKKSVVVKATRVEDENDVYVITEIREAKRTLKVDEMKTLFISFAAHQLKTPSSIVKGFIELLLREGRKAFSAIQWEHLESAYEANENLIRLSKNLLNVTKLEGGLIEPSLSSFDVREIVDAKVISHKLLTETKNISVHVNAPSSVVFESDPMFFSEIFDILLSNAIKYSPHGGVITANIEYLDRCLTVTVSDEGEGVPAEQESLLFQPFNASQTHTNSHGMGLMMARKYLELLGGSISYERRQTVGSCFKFIIPEPIH